jgi:hypothetical protein
MADVIIRNERLAWKLFEIARRENRSVDDIIETLVEEHYPNQTDDKPAPGSFAALNWSAEKAGIGRDSEPVDTSERSREILETEYADYLKRRMNEQSNSD